MASANTGTGDTGVNDNIRHELQSGERCLWTSRPSPWRSAVDRLPAIFFGMFVLSPHIYGNTLFKVPLLSSENLGPACAILVGVFFMLVPLYVYISAHLTTHAVTGQRLLTVTTLLGRRVKSHYMSDIRGFIWRNVGDGSGTIVIDFGYAKDSSGNNSRINETWYGVSDARHLDTTLREQPRHGENHPSAA